MANEKKAISVLIGVRIEKPYLVLRWKDEREVRKEVPIVVWEKQYVYIDEDYVSDEESSKYALSETIDKYFKEYLNNFANKISHLRKVIK